MARHRIPELRLDEVLDTPIDERVKGIPGGTPTFPLRKLGDFGWNVLAEDTPLPLLVLNRSALEHNLDLMRAFCERVGIEHAPHGKTTMAPQLFQVQLDAGCWGLTAATVEQLQVYRSVGVPRVVLANQLVGAPHLRYVAGQLAADPGFELVSFVDSPRGVAGLADAAREYRLDRPFDVCVEIGYHGGRTGVRDDAQLAAVADSVAATGGAVRLTGVGVFEGPLFNDRAGTSAPHGELTARDFLAGAVDNAHYLDSRGLLADDWMLTAGSSATFDAVADVFSSAGAPRVLLRSGCYLIHDHHMYATASPLAGDATPYAAELGKFRPALQLWTYVHSTPEPGLAFLTCGRRDAPEDFGLPVPLFRWPRGATEPVPLAGEVVSLNDQHCFLRHESELSVGDRVTLGISHPCTAFDKWRVIFVVDDDLNIIDGVLTYF